MTELTYTQVGDYYRPNLTVGEQNTPPLGKYGRMRKDYLEKHRPATYQMMVLEGTLKQHLLDVNAQAHEMLEQLIESMKKSEGITEQLKSSNQLEWVQRMNSIKHRAEEVVKTELIYV